MKKITTLVLTVAFIIALSTMTAMAAGSATITIGNVKAELNTAVVEVPITFTGSGYEAENPILSDMSFTLDLSEGLTLEGIAKATDNTMNWPAMSADKSSYYITISDNGSGEFSIQNNPEYGKFVLKIGVSDPSKCDNYKVGINTDEACSVVEYETYDEEVGTINEGSIFVGNKIDATVEEVVAEDGYGYGLSFVVADEHKAINKLIWNVDDKYSAAYDVNFSIVEGSVKVAFESAAQFAVDSINALMKSASAMYFTE